MVNTNFVSGSCGSQKNKRLSKVMKDIPTDESNAFSM